MSETTKYNYMENVLQSINKSYISLQEDDVNLNNRVLEAVLDKIVTQMKEDNLLFKSLYRNVFYGGSYYDGLRVGKPEEFDLDLLLVIPKYAKPVITVSDMAGYVHLQLQELEKFKNQPEASRFPNLSNLLNDQFYLNTSKVSAWLEGIITKALNKFQKSAAGESIIITSQGSLTAKMHKGGPAHTLKLKGKINNKNVVMDVDLVPCFVFTKEHWPGKPYRKNVVQKNGNQVSDFFIVPKKPSKTSNVDKYWRLSLQEQERVLISGYQNLKPTIKLFKKLRDTLDHKGIASYYIKTIFLWELENNKTLWSNPLSYVFMTMLEKYQKQLESKKILYYWNSKNNLISLSETTLNDMSNRLKRIIAHIKRDSTDEYVVAKYLLTTREFTDFQTSANFKKLKIINGCGSSL